MNPQQLAWNKDVKLILSDVDETIADLYLAAVPEMIAQLTQILTEGKVIFFITGQGIKSVRWRIVDLIPQNLRKNIIIGHCSGAEVVGHDKDGNLNPKPFYSIYDQTMNDTQKKSWREIVQKVINEFELKVHPVTPVSKFLNIAGNNPLAVMFEDRGPQITLEVINGYDLSPEQISALATEIPQTHGSYDLRIPIIERADKLFQEAKLPITPKLGGVFAVDFALKGVSKTTAVKYTLENPGVLSSVGLTPEDIKNPKSMEIWGDKFSTISGGTDRHMSEAVSPEVRSIDFRVENPEEFEKGYNIVLWTGEKYLHEGTLEYLKAR